MSLTLPQDLYDQLRAHGEETYPHECCGIMLGRAGEVSNEVVSLMRAGNTRTDSAHNRYHIAPQELIKAQPGDYVFIPPYVPHREDNPDPKNKAEVVIARSSQEAIVVNLPELYPLEDIQ